MGRKTHVERPGEQRTFCGSVRSGGDGSPLRTRAGPMAMLRPFNRPRADGNRPWPPTPV